MLVAAPEEQADAPPTRRPGWYGALATVLAATLVFWVLVAIGLWIYTGDARNPTTHTLVIPDGSIEQIAAGENPLEIPASWSFLADDTLVLVNEDRVAHWLGDFWVAANSTAEFTLQPDIGGSLFCTLHPSGTVTIDVGVRDFDWRLTVIPTLAIGPFIGLVLFGTRRVMNALDEPDRRSEMSSSA